MLGRIREEIANNFLLKIASFNSLSVVIQIAGGFIISKLIAIYLGERGMAFLGYLRNFLTSTQSVASLGFSNGVVKYVATDDDGDTNPSTILTTAMIVSLVATLGIALVLFFGASYWNDLIFGEDASFQSIFEYLAFSLPFMTLNALLISVINGRSNYSGVIRINIISNILSIALTAYLIITQALIGALLAIVIVPAMSFVVTALFIVSREKDKMLPRLSKFNFKALKKLSSYSIMAAFSMVVLPIVYIAIRNEITSNAGYWDAMTRISDFYLKFVATLMTLYILPQLAKAQGILSFRKEVFSFYKTILPLFALGMMILYFARNFVIEILYTDEFLPVAALFKWQLLGDFFKVASIVIGYQIIAKNNLKLFLITEIASLIVIYSTGIYFVQQFGYEGATIGHCISYAFHLLLLLFIFRKSLFGKIEHT